MSKMQKFLDNWVMYLALAVLAILAIPIMLVILGGIAHDFGIGILLAGLAGVIGGIWLIKFAFERFFRLYIRSWFSFGLWLFLTILIGFLLYSLCKGDVSFKEMLSWGGRRVPSSGGGVLVLPFAWIILFGLAFQKLPTDRPAKNALQASQKLGEAMYKAQQGAAAGAQGTTAGAQPNAGAEQAQANAAGNKDDVVEAEVVDK